MQGNFEIADVHARAFSADNNTDAVEVVVQLGGGAAGRAVFPAAESAPKTELVNYLNTSLSDILLSEDAYNHQAIHQVIQNTGVTESQWQQSDAAKSAVSLAVSRACTAQMQSDTKMISRTD
ncbi:MAG: hypothetical protein ACRDBO_12835 [Lachnospiraceae bacterium]